MVHHLGRCAAPLRALRSHRPTFSLHRYQWLYRDFHGSLCVLQATNPRTDRRRAAAAVDAWKTYSINFSHDDNKADNVFYGFLGPKRNVSKTISFADLVTPSGERIQIFSDGKHDSTAHAAFRATGKHVPVIVGARTDEEAKKGEVADKHKGRRTIYLESIRALNSMAPDVIVTDDVIFPPDRRPLQIRFHPELRARLEFRSWLKNNLSQSLLEKGFTDIETPTLFKSTPEGAREFIVPVRHPETKVRTRAYALSQSPQQYKQALVGSGVMRYMQWARCYRDEDGRADRQPEFTQLDMEWAFVGAEQVMQDVTDLVKKALTALRPSVTYQNVRGHTVPLVSELKKELTDEDTSSKDAETYQFTNMTFAECLEQYGTDKPDLRIPGRIRALQNLESIQPFVGMITDLPEPEIEGFVFPLGGKPVKDVIKAVTAFMNDDHYFRLNPDGMPQLIFYDTSRPLAGLSSIGHDFESILEQLAPGHEFETGDIIVFQARKKADEPRLDSSTMLGEFRKRLWKHLVEKDLMQTPTLGEPGSLRFLWVTEFPMFKMVEQGEPGQGGQAGIAAAHHPFTAPLSDADLEALVSGDPKQAKSAAYDLVLNGTEIGGGSVRNHIKSVQTYIMTNVLKMEPWDVSQFNHLLSVLDSGCPPHAGFALGFDRMVALLSGTSTVRDVIAFPKTMQGEDLFVKSPTTIANSQLRCYNLRVGAGQKEPAGRH